MPTATSQLGSAVLGQLRLSQLAATGPQTITPSNPAIASGESWGTPLIQGGSIVPAVIPTGESWGSPNVVGPINVTGIPSGIAWWPIEVAGPITVTAIPTGENWPTPLVKLGQKIIPTVIPTAEFWYNPAVLHVHTIAPPNPAIASGESWGTPVVAGGKKYINVRGIPSSEHWFSATVTGGSNTFNVFISGFDMTPFMLTTETTVNRCQVQSQTIGRWTAAFDLFDNTNTIYPRAGQSVLILDNGRRLFAGCIASVQTERYLSTAQAITYHVSATDKSGICDHRVITGKTYVAADWSDSSLIVRDIVTNYLNGEGIAITPTSLPTLGAPDADLPFNFVTVSNAFDQIARMTGTIWWVDSFCVLYFSSLSDLPPAPFSITETSQNWRMPQGSSYGMIVEETTANYYNKIYAVTNLTVIPAVPTMATPSPGGFVETITFNVNSPNCETQIDPVTGDPYVTGVLMSTPIGSVVSMTVNDVAQTVVDFANYTGQTSSGPEDYLWFFGEGQNLISWTDGPVPNNAVVVVQYVPYVPSTAASLAQYGDALNPLNPEGAPLGTCGSGLWEGVLQVTDISDQSSLNALAAAELARIGNAPPLVVTFETDVPGLVPGQALSAYIPLAKLPSSTLLITAVNGTYTEGLTAIAGGNFRWQVTATTNLDPGNWAKWYERILARTNNPFPLGQYEEPVFILGAGGSLSSGVNVTNPYIVGSTGLLKDIAIAAGTPPVDQDLILTITDTRQGSTTTIATVRMPAGTTSNQLLDFPVPASNQIYVYTQDTLNCSVSYSVTGPNPAPASAVTLKLTWTF